MAFRIGTNLGHGAMLALVSLLLYSITGCSTLGKPFLYEVEVDGKKTTLFGSLHQGVSSEDLPASVHSRFKKAKVFVTDSPLSANLVSFKELSDEDKERKAKGLFIRRTGQLTLDRLLSEATWKGIREKLSKKFSETDLLSLSPLGAWVALQMENDPAKELRDFQENMIPLFNSMSLNFIREAEVSKINILFLDDRTEPENYLDCLDLISIREIESYFADFRGPTMRVVALAKSYRRGDEEEMRSQLEDGISAEEAKCRIREPNENWLEKIKAVQDGGQASFISVDVLNLLSAQGGLLQMLRKNGAIIRRIK